MSENKKNNNNRGFYSRLGSLFSLFCSLGWYCYCCRWRTKQTLTANCMDTHSTERKKNMSRKCWNSLQRICSPTPPTQCRNTNGDKGKRKGFEESWNISSRIFKFLIAMHTRRYATCNTHAMRVFNTSIPTVDVYWWMYSKYRRT